MGWTYTTASERISGPACSLERRGGCDSVVISSTGSEKGFSSGLGSKAGLDVHPSRPGLTMASGSGSVPDSAFTSMSVKRGGDDGEEREGGGGVKDPSESRLM